MNWQLFFTTFVTIFIAELGDKTQFAAMAASAQAPSSREVMMAVVLALSAAGILGVVAGKFLAQYLDPQVMRYVSGGLFIAIGCWILLKK